MQTSTSRNGERVLPSALSLLLVLLCSTVFGQGETIRISPGADGETPFQNALDDVKPGDIIELSPGRYDERVTTKVNGERDNRITIRGAPGEDRETIVLHGSLRDDINSFTNRIFEIQHDYYTVEGFTINGDFRDIPDDNNPGMVEDFRDKLIYVHTRTQPTMREGGYESAIDGLIIQNMRLKNAGGECLRLRWYVTNAEIRNNKITDCGIYDFRYVVDGNFVAKNGEGIYIGTSLRQWDDGVNPSNAPDVCMGNRVVNNYISTRGNEGIDVKEGTINTLIQGNEVYMQKDPDSGGIGSRGDFSTIIDNHIQDADGAGVRLGGGERDGITYGNNNKIIGNNIVNCLFSGVKIMTAPQQEVCGNTIETPPVNIPSNLPYRLARGTGLDPDNPLDPTAPCDVAACHPIDNPCPEGQECCSEDGICKDELLAGACGDPHMTGFNGQKFDFTGQDGLWYCLLSDGSLHLNMRVTSPVPEVPEITYITGVSIVTADSEGVEHSIVVTVKDPHSLESSCPSGSGKSGNGGASSPCLADGALSVLLDGGEAAADFPGKVDLGRGVSVEAVNIPGACRSFGFDKYWERKKLEYAQSGRRLTEESIGGWILGDPTVTNVDECAEYVSEAVAGGDDSVLFDHVSEHASFKIVTPRATIRVSHGRLHQIAIRDPMDQYDWPEHLTWQQNVAIDVRDVSLQAKGVLGETVVPTRDDAGKVIMAGMEAIRGDRDDYLVAGPLDFDFAMNK